MPYVRAFQKNVALAKRIKALRQEDTGLKQMNIVGKYNVEKQTISRWESEVKIDDPTGSKSGIGITIYSVAEFCKIIGITLTDTDFFDDDLFK